MCIYSFIYLKYTYIRVKKDFLQFFNAREKHQTFRKNSKMYDINTPDFHGTLVFNNYSKNVTT